MPRQESTISPTSAGAGRSQDWTWPDSLNTTPTSTLRSRGGVQRVASTAVAGAGAFAVGNSQNVDCGQLRTTAGGDLFALIFDTILPFNINTATGNDGNAYTDDFHAWRYVVRMAGIGVAPTADNLHDFGCCVTLNGSGAGGVGGLLKDGASGWSIQLVDTNTVKLFTRGPNGLVSATIKSAPFDTTKFHTYDMRFVSADATNAATFALLIDNVPVTLDPLTSSWAAGTNNPSSAQTGTAVGFIPRLISFAGTAGVNSLLVNRVKLISAPDIPNTI